MKLRVSSPLTALLVAAPLVLGQCDTAEERGERHFQSGVELAEAGDTDRALVELRNVFQLDGRHREARQLYAKLERERGNSGEAYGQYLRLVEQYPRDFEARRNLGEMAINRMDWPDVERHLDVAAEIDPDDLSVRAMVATMEYREAIREEDAEARAAAAKEARAVLREDDDSLIARRIVINELLSGDDPQAALPEIVRALEQERDNLEYHELKLRLLQADGQTEAATEQFEAMHARFPDNEALRDGLISWYMELGDTDAAEGFLRDLAAQSDEPGPSVTVVRFLRETEGDEVAEAELDRLIESGEHTATFRAARASLMLERGEVDAALSELEDTVEGAEPSDEIHDIRTTLAELHERTGDEAAARAEVERILEADGDHAGALKKRARWLIEDDDPDAALRALRRAQQSAPRDPEVLTLMARTYERIGDRQLAGDRLSLAAEVSGQAPVESLSYARFLIEEDRLSTARAVLDDALRQSPQNVDLMRTLGEVHIADGAWERAESQIAQLREIDSAAARGATNALRNSLLVAQERTDESIAFLQGLIDRGEADIRAAARIVEGHMNAGRIEAAEDYLDDALAEDPEQPVLRFLRAGVNAIRGDAEAAEEIYAALIEEYPSDEAPVRALYQMQRQLGETDAAEETLDTALERMPDSVWLNWARAGDLENSGDFEGAIAIYEHLYESNRDNAVIANNLASLISTHRSDAEDLERAHSIARRLRDSDVPAFQDTYGWIAHRRGNHEEALRHLEPAAEGLPDDPLVQYHLGMTYAALERHDAARETLQRALELAAGSPWPQFIEAQETLATLPEPVQDD